MTVSCVSLRGGHVTSIMKRFCPFAILITDTKNDESNVAPSISYITHQWRVASHIVKEPKVNILLQILKRSLPKVTVGFF